MVEITIIVFICMLLNIVIHEVGHMIGGYILGYKIVFIRIGSKTLVKEENGWSVKKFNVPGTAGQCIMEPPSDREFKWRLYFLGGIMGNFVLVIIGLIFIFLTKSTRLIGIELAFFALYFIVANGLPLKIGGIVNDGYHIFRMKKEDEKKLYAQLMIAVKDMKGVCIKDMDEDYFECNEERPENFFDCYIMMIKALRYIECHEYEKAKLLLNRIINSKAISFYKWNAKSELLLIEIEENGKDANLELLDKKTKKYVKKQVYALSTLLLNYALLSINNDKKAEKMEQRFLEFSKETIEKGEIDIYLERYEKIKQKLM